MTVIAREGRNRIPLIGLLRFFIFPRAKLLPLRA